MNIDLGFVNQILSQVHFPIGKNDLIQFAQQNGANDQIIGALQHLPDKTFNSAQDVLSSLGGGQANIGGFKI